MPLNKYAPQVATHRRTQNAILESTKQLIATTGIKKMSMIEIADSSEVSRATLYNHYRDKESVIRALCESELARLVQVAQAAADTTKALEELSIQVSTDPALAAMRIQDPDQLTLALTKHDDQLWMAFGIALNHLLGNAKGALALRWLLGQALHPLSAEQSRAQAEALSGIANL
ncbi:DNA-binding HTH domain, TetR-type [Candidatus Nanopelagicaceae bacterium]